MINLLEQVVFFFFNITKNFAAPPKVRDRIAVMLNGKIIEEGSSDKIVAAPQQAYTRDLLRAASTLHSTESSTVE